MYNNFTGNPDIDIVILSSLSLTDIRSACQSNKYTATLCKNPIIKNKLEKAQKKADKILNIINHREYGIKLQLNNENQIFDPFLDIMDDLNSNYYPDYSEKSPLTVLADPISHLDINQYYDKNKYYVTYYTGDIDAPDRTTYELTETQIKEFLLIIYYDKLILIL